MRLDHRRNDRKNHNAQTETCFNRVGFAEGGENPGRQQLYQPDGRQALHKPEQDGQPCTRSERGGFTRAKGVEGHRQRILWNEGYRRDHPAGVKVRIGSGGQHDRDQDGQDLAGRLRRQVQGVVAEGRPAHASHQLQFWPGQTNSDWPSGDIRSKRDHRDQVAERPDSKNKQPLIVDQQRTGQRERA